MENRPKGKITQFRDIPSGNRGSYYQSRDFHSGDIRRDRRPADRRAPAQADGRARSGERGQARENSRGGRSTSLESKRTFSDAPRRRQDERGGRPKSRQKKKKRMPLQLRRLLIVLTLFGSLLLTAVIAIFLVFKVDAVELTGDQLYSEADVMQACNYHIGDNLFFLSTTDKEQLLPEKLPYVGKAKITRKIPGTIVIQLTAAKPACQFENGGQYVLVDETGKVMDMKAEATAGVMLVTGTEPGNQRYGKPFVLADAEKLSAYQQILAKLIAENAVADVTGLDFTDVHNISMVYQDRITMKLGGVADLDYKLRFGLSTVRDNISSVKKGTLDLSLAPETGKAPFSENLSQNQGTEESAQNNGGETQEKTYSFASNPGRGRDIPDKPYTGGSDAGDAAAGTTAVPEDAADTDNAENGGDGSSYSENTDDSAGTGDTENTQGNGSGENAENTPQAENGEGAE